MFEETLSEDEDLDNEEEIATKVVPIIEKVKYPEPTDEEIEQSRIFTMEYLKTNPLPETDVLYSSKTNMAGLVRSNMYRLNQTVNSSSGKRIKRKKKKSIAEEKKSSLKKESFSEDEHSLKRNNSFDDYVWKSDFSDSDTEEGTSSKLYVDQIMYLQLCKQHRIAPCAMFLRGLTDDAITVRYHSLTADDIKICCTVLLESINVNKLDFKGNEFKVEGARHIGDLLTTNAYVTYLDISECGILSKGAELVTHSALQGDRLTYLNLSGNNLQEDDALFIGEYMKATSSLKELYLSQNLFTEKGAIILASAIALSDTIEKLDLSWNHIRRQGAIAISKALKTNIVLREINLSWNGFHVEGCRAIGEMLAINSTLELLDLSGNRVDRSGFENILKGCKQNSNLNSLKLASNSVTDKGAISFLTMLHDNPNCIIRDLDITGQSVNTTFLQKLEQLQSSRVIRVLHGPVLYENQIKGPGGIVDSFPNDPPLTVVLEYLRIRAINIAELFAIVEKPPGKKQVLTRKEFKICMQSISFPVRERSLTKLIERIDMGDQDYLEYTALVKEEKEHKRCLIKTKHTSDKEPTTIGMIHAKLNYLMYKNNKET